MSIREVSEEAVAELKVNIEFMSAKLQGARELIGKSNVVIQYNNGGGQSGLRANPAFGEYEKLMNTYSKAVSQLSSILATLPDDAFDDDMDALVSGFDAVR